MSYRLAMIAAIATACLQAEWNPRLAANYLDSRQKQWFEWKPAAAHGGPCVSCHTGTTYLLARPALRRTLLDSEPTRYESGLLDALRARLNEPFPFPADTKEPLSSQALAVESVHAALFLAIENSGKPELSAAALAAFDRMWAQQIRDGEMKGSWKWFSFKLDPWEMPHSAFYGATLAALATGHSPASYRTRPEVRERIASLTEYLQKEQESQPLHHRAMLLWAASNLPSVLDGQSRKRIIEALLQKQLSDGGWSIQSLGPWTEHAAAPASPEGSGSYATGLAAFALKQAGVTGQSLSRAQTWLKAHQHAEGYWQAESMNKTYKPDSIPALFMRDAATSFAVLALIE